METHYFWAFFVVALLIGFVLGTSVAGITGFAIWPWQQISKEMGQRPIIKDGVTTKQPGSTIKPAVLSLKQNTTITANSSIAEVCSMICGSCNLNSPPVIMRIKFETIEDEGGGFPPGGGGGGPCPPGQFSPHYEIEPDMNCPSYMRCVAKPGCGPNMCGTPGCM